MVCSFVFVVVAALGQSWLQKEAFPAATGPAYDASVGYTFVTMPIPSAGRVNLNGLDVSAGVDFKPRWGVTVDSNFVRTSSVLNVPHQAYVLSFHVGPVFYPVEHGNPRMFIRALAGVGRVDGAVPQSETGSLKYLHGWTVGPSYVVGGGVEQSISRSLALRMSGDYLRTAFFDRTGTVLPQNDLRVTVSVVVFPSRRKRE